MYLLWRQPLYAQSCNTSPVCLAQNNQDDVDKLFAEYEAQAEADRTAADQKSLSSKKKAHKSMREVRQEGLEAPIAKDNKYCALTCRLGTDLLAETLLSLFAVCCCIRQILAMMQGLPNVICYGL